MNLRLYSGIALVVAGFIDLMLSFFAIVTHVELFLTILFSWGFVGIGLTLMGMSLLLMVKIEDKLVEREF